ncbi:glycoside hydrolase family 97 protein, partial [Candidatus Latescibacterota bacterium]
SSPDGAVHVSVTTNGGPDGDSLSYTVTFNGTQIVTDSPLGMEFADGSSFGTDMYCTEAYQINEHDSNWETVVGKSASVRDHYKEIEFRLSDDSKNFIDIVIRAYNDGVAFRYVLKSIGGADTVVITRELSGFRFAGDYNCWALKLENYITSYETSFTPETLSDISTEDLTGLPLLVKVSDTAWAAVTEANLTDYAGMYLKGDSTDVGLLRADLSPLPDGDGVCVKRDIPQSDWCTTPWRVIMLADEPGRLIESDIVLNLNEPCAIDASWIKPGKTAWDWWCCQTVVGEDFEGAMDDRTMKYFIDFAAEYGLEYMLVDAGWYAAHTDGDADIAKSIPEIDVPELVRYANSKNVDIILWLHWKCAVRQMDEAFPLYKSWGVKGVKVDYMSRDDQEMVNLYRDMIKTSAENELLIDFHGAYKPTGIRRTYPSLITREGVMGLEWLKASNYVDPEHNCTLPFTRMLAGPMDYTPGGFNNVLREDYKIHPGDWGGTIAPLVLGTRSHQLALFVIFESPLQMVADHPANYRENPESDFIRQVPVSWDETKVLNGEVSDYITMARRKGDDWYLGSITDWDARELSVNLDFLGSGYYRIEIFADGFDAETNAKSVSMSEDTVNSRSTLNITMVSGGGYAARLVPVK